MRLATVTIFSFSVLVFSSLAGCAAPLPGAVSHGSDTAVRAEARRISSERPDRAEHLIAASPSARF